MCEKEVFEKILFFTRPGEQMNLHAAKCLLGTIVDSPSMDFCDMDREGYSLLLTLLFIKRENYIIAIVEELIRVSNHKRDFIDKCNKILNSAIEHNNAEVVKYLLSRDIKVDYSKWQTICVINIWINFEMLLVLMPTPKDFENYLNYQDKSGLFSKVFAIQVLGKYFKKDPKNLQIKAEEYKAIVTQVFNNNSIIQAIVPFDMGGGMMRNKLLHTTIGKKNPLIHIPVAALLSCLHNLNQSLSKAIIDQQFISSCFPTFKIIIEDYYILLNKEVPEVQPSLLPSNNPVVPDRKVKKCKTVSKPITNNLFEALPKELVLAILEYCPIKDLLPMSQTCQYGRIVVDNIKVPLNKKFGDLNLLLGNGEKNICPTLE